jgi:hypothetical protein
MLSFLLLIRNGEPRLYTLAWGWGPSTFSLFSCTRLSRLEIRIHKQKFDKFLLRSTTTKLKYPTGLKKI